MQGNPLLEENNCFSARKQANGYDYDVECGISSLR